MKDKAELTEAELMVAKSWETIFIGVVAENMGYANVSLVVKAGKKVFEELERMRYKDFKNIKKYIKVKK